MNKKSIVFDIHEVLVAFVYLFHLKYASFFSDCSEFKTNKTEKMCTRVHTNVERREKKTETQPGAQLYEWFFFPSVRTYARPNCISYIALQFATMNYERKHTIIFR